MNKSKIALILGLMCIVLTCGIVVQVRTIKGTGSTISTNSQENELRDAVLKAKEKYDNIISEAEKKCAFNLKSAKASAQSQTAKSVLAEKEKLPSV